MAKREKVVQTYGRHRNRVVTTNDLWSSGEEHGKNLFSCSDESSLSVSDKSRNTSSMYYSFSCHPKTKLVGIGSGNKENRKPRKAKIKAVDKLFVSTDSANSSENSSNVGRRRPLQDRNGIFEIKCEKKESRQSQRAKRKQPSRAKKANNNTCKISNGTLEGNTSNHKANIHDSKVEATHFNFSQFDNYSLVLSDSPLREGEKESDHDSLLKELGGLSVQQTPDIITRGKPKLRSVTSVGTSTPNVYQKPKQTKTSGCKLKGGEISLIEHFDSNPNTPSQLSKAAELAELQKSLERLSVRDFSKISDDDGQSDCSDHFSDKQELNHALRKCQVVLDRCKNLTKNDGSNEVEYENIERSSNDRNDLNRCEVVIQKITDSFITQRSRPGEKKTKSIHNSLDSIVELSFDASADLFNTDLASEESESDLAEHVSPKRGYMLRSCRQASRKRNVSSESAISTISEIEEVDEEVESEDDQPCEFEKEEQEEIEEGQTEEEEDSESEECEEEYESEESVHEDVGIEEAETESDSDVDASTFLYMLNDSQYNTPPDSRLMEPEMATMSYHTAEGLEEMSVDNNSQTNDIQFLSVSERRDSLCQSFKEILTPSKSKKIPLLSAEEKVLLQCEQESVMSFSTCIPSSMMNKCVKIGEGVYGEVFRTEVDKKSVALKIIPIQGDFPVNDEPQKTFEEILPEIVISRELSAMRGAGKNCTENYVEVRRVSLVKGHYPAALLKQWDIYNKAKQSENDRPEIFDNDQLFIVFEFADGGCALEGFKFGTILEAKSVLNQVVCALAVAEAELEFEHRDLHWGNVLVKRTGQETLQYTLNNELCEMDVHGVNVSIIDFTLSRLTKDGCTVFTDLSVDKTLFEGEGDYQFEVYRLMKKENKDNWEQHHPFTNIVWIHYLTDKLIHETRYPSSDAQHRALLRDMKAFYKDILSYRSAEHLLTECIYFNG